jgi:hypothetical protein
LKDLSNERPFSFRRPPCLRTISLERPLQWETILF